MTKILENDGVILDIDRLRNATNAADFMLIMEKININGLRSLTFAERDLLDKSNALSPLRPVQLATENILKTVVPAAQVTEVIEKTEPVVINYKALTQIFPASKATALIDDLKNNVPLNNETATFLIEKKIIQPKADVEKKQAATRKLGFFDRIAEYLYNNF